MKCPQYFLCPFAFLPIQLTVGSRARQTAFLGERPSRECEPRTTDIRRIDDVLPLGGKQSDDGIFRKGWRHRGRLELLRGGNENGRRTQKEAPFNSSRDKSEHFFAVLFSEKSSAIQLKSLLKTRSAKRQVLIF
jgi:hypothetical protein